MERAVKETTRDGAGSNLQLPLRSRHMTMPSIPYQLAAVGAALHGEAWHEPLARDLTAYNTDHRFEVDEDRVRRWITPDAIVPIWVVEALPRLLAERRMQGASHLDVVARSLGYPNLDTVATVVMEDDARRPGNPKR